MVLSDPWNTTSSTRSVAAANYCVMLVLSLWIGTISAATSSNVRCGNDLVSIGDTKAEVLVKCGAPSWQDSWTSEIVSNLNSLDEVRTNLDRERWVYNFGPNSFLRFLLFENGRLAKISTGGYGYDEKHPSIRPCEGDDIKNGLTQYEVLQRCGEPFYKDTRYEQRLVSMDKGLRRIVGIRVDEWTYNFGPTRFMRILRFENGKLVKIETGNRGFKAP